MVRQNADPDRCGPTGAPRASVADPLPTRRSAVPRRDPRTETSSTRRVPRQEGAPSHGRSAAAGRHVVPRRRDAPRRRPSVTSTTSALAPQRSSAGGTWQSTRRSTAATGGPARTRVGSTHNASPTTVRRSVREWNGHGDIGTGSGPGERMLSTELIDPFGNLLRFSRCGAGLLRPDEESLIGGSWRSHCGRPPSAGRSEWRIAREEQS
jgi:hypothetical protein